MRAILDPQTGDLIDRALVLYFKAPHSFTGEDVLEIQMHGVQSLVDRVCLSLKKIGIALALPGEFSFRSVKNDRQSLIEAEGLQQAFAVDGIDAKIASKLLGLSSEVEIRLNDLISDSTKLLQKARARIEAGIDFSEAEEEQAAEIASATTFVGSAHSSLSRLLSTHENFSRSGAEIRVAIVGSPNVGKSTLFNLLCGVDRALVSPIAGTTRDVIDVRVKSPSGLTYRFFDTAGIHEEFSDSVEQQGIARGLDWASRADFVIQVAKKGHGSSFSSLLNRDIDFQIWSFSEDKKIAEKTNDLFLDLLRDAKEAPSLVFGLLDRLHKERLKAQSSESLILSATSDRQILLIKKSMEEMSLALECLAGARPLELSGDHLMKSEEYLQAVLGNGLSDEYVGEIFSQFCLGK